ncbi:MAG: LLM class flavin-dependent oxidoreductase [Actinomycetota bacterium]
MTGLDSQSGRRLRYGAYGPFQPLSAIYETANWAEQRGLDSYWLGDRSIAFPTPDVLEAWSALVAVATRTERIGLGMAVTDPFRRHPAVLAQTVTALDHISDGRALPGIGMGERVNVVPFGMPMEKKTARLQEFVELMKLYWSGEPIHFEGKYFSSKGGVLRPTPIQSPHPPVWMAGNAPRTLEVVGRVADAWLPAALTPDMYREDLGRIREVAAEAGRDPDAIEPGLFMYTVLHEDAGQARETAHQLGRGIAVWWRGSLRRLGYDLGSDDLTVSNFDGSPEAMDEWLKLAEDVPAEAVDQLVNSGDPGQLKGRMEEFVAAGVRHFVVISLDGLGDIARWKETVTCLCDEVIPALGDRPAAVA